MFNKQIRAWHPGLHQMFKVGILNFETEVIHGYPFISDKYGSEAVFKMSEVTISQASGLEDEAGFNVFKDDIIEFEGSAYVLKYGNFGNSITQTNGFGWFLDDGLHSFPYLGGADKIGNIFENPEIPIGMNY